MSSRIQLAFLLILQQEVDSREEKLTSLPLHIISGDIVRVIPVLSKKQAVLNQDSLEDLFGSSEDEIEYTFCSICGNRNNEQEMLLCDRCDDGQQYAISDSYISRDVPYSNSAL